jgi:hypothetical protein
MNLSGKLPQPKPEKVAPDPAHLARVRELPCVICCEWMMPQLTPTQAHHCIHGRHGTRKVPDTMTIPLCEGHHQGLWDTSKIALHREPNAWRAAYGADTDWLSWVEGALARQDAATIGEMQ